MPAKRGRDGKFQWHDPRECPECGKKCASYARLCDHMGAKHPHINPLTFDPYKCSISGCKENAPWFIDGEHLCDNHAREKYDKKLKK